ncbi:CDGSH iron-sulfur domain-containing protein [Streptomyces sp. G-G2]|uniref:CDGSH iron-sulfur domain-containing protein n=1 Tax=Streptomyces sp. G-G2 TaxID=3046201 RepID=UPI0024BAC647|nr:CDGSH iron-sulfur domain-containing protein [Streptomyces sp. G-G2]MDJ0386056.1 CDGSH iron-sulfur domain-containing protein [Streptomyces sp. G-G2]
MSDDPNGNVSARALPRRIRGDRAGGPLLVDGPVEFVLDDGTTAASDRMVVAVCTCGRSRIYPWCDTSHRARAKSGPGADTTRRTGPTGRAEE